MIRGSRILGTKHFGCRTYQCLECKRMFYEDLRHLKSYRILRWPYQMQSEPEERRRRAAIDGPLCTGTPKGQLPYRGKSRQFQMTVAEFLEHKRQVAEFDRKIEETVNRKLSCPPVYRPNALLGLSFDFASIERRMLLGSAFSNASRSMTPEDARATLDTWRQCFPRAQVKPVQELHDVVELNVKLEPELIQDCPPCEHQASRDLHADVARTLYGEGSGRDLYRELAAGALEKPYDAVTPEERKAAKDTCWMLMYGPGFDQQQAYAMIRRRVQVRK